MQRILTIHYRWLQATCTALWLQTQAIKAVTHPSSWWLSRNQNSYMSLRVPEDWKFFNCLCFGSSSEIRVKSSKSQWLESKADTSISTVRSFKSIATDSMMSRSSASGREGGLFCIEFEWSILMRFPICSAFYKASIARQLESMVHLTCKKIDRQLCLAILSSSPQVQSSAVDGKADAVLSTLALTWFRLLGWHEPYG